MRDSLLDDKLDDLGARTIGDARLCLADSMAIMAALPTGCIDMVFADPPYFLSNGGTTMRGGKRVAVDKGEWDASAGVRIDRNYHRQWLRLVQRILRPEGTLWVSGTHHNIFSVGWSMIEAGWNILNTVTWEKPNPPPNLGCRTLTHSTEAIIWAAPAVYVPLRHVFNYGTARADNDGKQLKDVWRIGAPGASEKEHGRHPTQKPLELMRRIVELSTEVGGVVLDPFAGSGTTGVAALELARRFVGIEADPEHAELAVKRLRAVAEKVG